MAKTKTSPSNSGWPPAGTKGKEIPVPQAACPEDIDPAYQGKNGLKKGSY